MKLIILTVITRREARADVPSRSADQRLMKISPYLPFYSPRNSLIINGPATLYALYGAGWPLLGVGFPDRKGIAEKVKGYSK